MRRRRESEGGGAAIAPGCLSDLSWKRFRISELRLLKISVLAFGRRQVALRFPQPTGHSVPSRDKSGPPTPIFEGQQCGAFGCAWFAHTRMPAMCYDVLHEDIDHHDSSGRGTRT